MKKNHVQVIMDDLRTLALTLEGANHDGTAKVLYKAIHLIKCQDEDLKEFETKMHNMLYGSHEDL